MPLKSFLPLLDKWEELQYPFTRKNVPGRMQDIQDGKLYQELQGPGGFLSVPEHTGLILCSDGVQLFKSAQQSFWPVLLAVTGLPPGKRMNAENLLLAGVWQGPVKPPMNVILGRVVDSIQKLEVNGIQFQSPNGVKFIRAKLLLAVFDLPAKAIATNFVQYNGCYSCTYCLDKGRNRHTFPPSENHTARSKAGIDNNATEAEARSKAGIDNNATEAERKGHSVYGVKGKSILSRYINIYTDVPVDYMHAVLEGVTKRLLSTFLDSKYHSCRFYLGNVANEIDKRMVSIKPPEEFRRSPRSVSTMKHWKASEFRAWLLYYCLPVLGDLLPPDYVYHLSLLVSSMHILLGDAIEITELNKARTSLILFYTLVPQLYSNEMCTANMHSLIHLPEMVVNWGPLWCYSCFGFESMNGHLRKNCHGTGYVPPQLIHNVRMCQYLPFKGKQVAKSANAGTAEFIRSLSGVKEKSSELEIKSRITHKKITDPVAQALFSASFLDLTTPLPSLPVCTTVRYKSTIYSVYKEGKCRNGSICVNQDQTGLHFGSILNFCFSKNNLVAIIKTLNEVNQHFFDGIRSPSLSDLDSTTCNDINNFLFCVTPADSLLHAIPISSILAKCVCIPVRNSLFVITIPNMFEHH